MTSPCHHSAASYVCAELWGLFDMRRREPRQVGHCIPQFAGPMPKAGQEEAS